MKRNRQTGRHRPNPRWRKTLSRNFGEASLHISEHTDRRRPFLSNYWLTKSWCKNRTVVAGLEACRFELLENTLLFKQSSSTPFLRDACPQGYLPSLGANAHDTPTQSYHSYCVAPKYVFSIQLPGVFVTTHGAE